MEERRQRLVSCYTADSSSRIIRGDPMQSLLVTPGGGGDAQVLLVGCHGNSAGNQKAH